MNTKVIELQAVNHLKLHLSKGGHLIPDIPEFDKSPSWDGEILAYKNNTDKKDCLIGKIRIQVKGKYSQKPKGRKRSFSIDKADLVNYKNDGGAILFVVYLNESFQQYFYNDLTAEKLKYYLKKSAGRQSKKISVPIFPLSDSPSEVDDLVVNTIEHCRMQTSFANQPIYSIDEFAKRSDFDSLQLKFFGVDTNKNPLELLLGNFPKYWYGKTKGSNVPIPLEYQDVTNRKIVMIENAEVTVKKRRY